MKLSESLQPAHSTHAHATRVLATPELLGIVLSYLDREQLPPTALVCRRWLEIARDHIWRHVEHAQELFRLLVPLRKDIYSGLHFERTPTREDWERFRPLASRVRTLVIDDPSRRYRHLNFLLAKMAESALWRPLLPNLRELAWLQQNRREQVALFLHPGLDKLELSVPGARDEGYPPEILFDEIKSQAPFLSELTVRIYPDCASIRSIAPPLIDLLLHLKSSLQSLCLPEYGVTQAIFEAASQIHGLETLVVADSAASFDDVSVFAPRLEANSFPSLSHLAISAPLPDLVRLLENSHFPSGQLLALGVRAVRPETQDSVVSLHTAVARECPRLYAFNSSLHAPYDAEGVIARWPESPPPDTALSWDSLAPLTALKELQSLFITHHHDLDVTALQLVDLARGLPELVRLCLNPSPFEESLPWPSIKLADLEMLVDAMPCIEELYLYLDARELDVDPARRIKKPFARLQTLGLFQSRLDMDKRREIGLFLASVMPAGAKIDASRWEEGDYIAPPTKEDWKVIRDDVAILLKEKHTVGIA